MSAAATLTRVSKLYRSAAGAQDRTLKNALAGMLRRALGGGPPEKVTEFCALDDVSLEIPAGKAFGLIGRNGSGKSTLLKILSKVTAPTSGRIQLNGRVGSLLEVGTGFHPELSGRENIFLAGGIQGMSPADIRRHFDGIVAFSEIEAFLDEPVKHYSSGMYMKLAFAVAAHMEPDILLVDEALAVGDLPFQRKCVARMREMVAKSSTVVLVSHNHQSIVNFCQNAAWLERGRLIRQGNAEEVVAGYLESISVVKRVHRWSGDAGNDAFRLRATYVEFQDDADPATDGSIRIGFRAELLQPVVDLVAAVELRAEQGSLLAYSAHDDALAPPAPVQAPGSFAWEVTIPPNTLAAGVYEVIFDFGVHNKRRIVERAGALMFQIRNSSGLGRRLPTEKWSGAFRPAWHWRRTDAGEAE